VSSPIATSTGADHAEHVSCDQTTTQTNLTSPSDPLRRRRVKVIGFDGSEYGRYVLEGAARRASPGDRLIIVHALDPTPRDRSSAPAVYAQACERMLAAVDPSLFDGIDFELRIVNGPPAQALIEVARHTGAAAIVIGTRWAPSRLGQRTIRSQLEAGPIPVSALVGQAEQGSHPLAEPIDRIHRCGYDSFPASDPPSSWSGLDNGASHRATATSGTSS